MTIALALGVTGVFAQDAAAPASGDMLKNKKGWVIHPETGNWGIGFAAAPMLDWAFDKAKIMSPTPAAGMASNAVTPQAWNQPTPGGGGMPGIVLTGKYFTSNTTAWRASLRIASMSEKYSWYKPKADHSKKGDIDTTGKVVKNVTTTKAMNITLGVGQEYRRNINRLVGVYGWQAMLGMGNGKTTYKYGNEELYGRQSDIQDADTGTVVMGVNTGNRPMENKQGSSFMFGAKGFIGVEYFFAPKISVGAEYGWGIYINTQKNGVKKYERFEYNTDPAINTWADPLKPVGKVVKTETEQPGNNGGLTIDTDLNMMNNGRISLNFYF